MKANQYLASSSTGRISSPFLPLIICAALSLGISGCSTISGSTGTKEATRSVKNVEVVASPSTIGTDYAYSHPSLHAIEEAIIDRLGGRYSEAGIDKLTVVIDGYSVRGKGAKSSLLKPGKDEISTRVYVSDGSGTKAEFQAKGRGGGGLFKMSQLSRVREVAKKLSDDIVKRYARTDFGTRTASLPTTYELSSAKEYRSAAEIQKASLGNTAMIPAGSGRNRAGGAISHGNNPASGDTLKNCNIEQVETMFQVGLSTEQIAAACR